MRLKHIKANGIYYKPQEAGVKDLKGNTKNFPVCTIKKLMFGRWQIDYFDIDVHFNIYNGYLLGSNPEDKPNQRLILHRNGIEEIKYLIE